MKNPTEIVDEDNGWVWFPSDGRPKAHLGITFTLVNVIEPVAEVEPDAQISLF